MPNGWQRKIYTSANLDSANNQLNFANPPNQYKAPPLRFPLVASTPAPSHGWTVTTPMHRKPEVYMSNAYQQALPQASMHAFHTAGCATSHVMGSAATTVPYSGNLSGPGFAQHQHPSAQAFAGVQASSHSGPSITTKYPYNTPAADAPAATTSALPSPISFEDLSEAPTSAPISHSESDTASQIGENLRIIPYEPKRRGRPPKNSTNAKYAHGQAPDGQRPSEVGPIRKESKRQPSYKHCPGYKYTDEERERLPFECQVCGIRMGKFGDMKRHYEVHKDKWHFCPHPLCGHPFSRSDSLKRHMNNTRIHPIPFDAAAVAQMDLDECELAN